MCTSSNPKESRLRTPFAQLERPERIRYLTITLLSLHPSSSSPNTSLRHIIHIILHHHALLPLPLTLDCPWIRSAHYLRAYGRLDVQQVIREEWVRIA